MPADDQARNAGSKRPLFAIVNTTDAPCERNVAEHKSGIGYCYMQGRDDKHLSRFDGMTPKRPTSMEEFGFDVHISGNIAIFIRSRESTATYEDGENRNWQGLVPMGGVFHIPLLGVIKRKGSYIRKREAHQ